MSYLRGLHIVVSNTYCVVFFVLFFMSCVPYVASFSGLSILITPVLSNVYLKKNYIQYPDVKSDGSIDCLH